MGSRASVVDRGQKKPLIVNVQTDNVETNEDDLYNSSPVEATKTFNGIKINTALMCRDQFVSKYSGDLMFRWRDSTIVDLFPPNNAKIHFEGWSEKHDIIVDLNSEWNRLAPYNFLSEQQQTDGRPLDEDQSAAVYAFLITGKAPAPNINGSEDDMRYEIENHYYIGRKVEVQDIFRSKQTKEVICKWRNAEIMEVSDCHVKVHYIGWDSEWDDVIDIINERYRIRLIDPLGKAISPNIPFKRHQSLGHTTVAEKHPTDVDDYHSRRKSTPAMGVALIAELTFKTRMRNLGLHVIEMQSDGNCLFRAVAHQIFLDEERHFELRELCTKHMITHRERFSVFCSLDFDDYLKRMLVPGTWGDDLEIRALEEIIDRLICIYCADSRELKPLNTNFNEQNLLKDVAPIIISYHGNNHYNSVVNENEPLPLPRRASKTVLEARSR